MFLPSTPLPRPRVVSVATTGAQWAGHATGACRGGACGGSGVRALRALRAVQTAEMLRAWWLRLCAALGSLLLGQAEAPSPGVPPERSRPYAVLRGQNLGERGGMPVCSRSRAGGRLRGAGGERAAARELPPGLWSSGSPGFLLSASGLAASVGSLCAGGTCWNWKPETSRFARASLALWIQARQPGLSQHPSSYRIGRPILSNGVCN